MVTVFYHQHQKHPEPAKIYKDALLTGPTQKIPSSYFDEIDKKNPYKKQLRRPKEQQDPCTLILNSFGEFFAISISKLKGNISEK